MPSKRISPRQVIICVSEYTGVSVSDIKAKSRKRDKVYARHLSMYLVYCLIPSQTLNSIGHIFGRDHSSVVHAKQHIQDIMYLPEIKGCIAHVTGTLQPGEVDFNMGEIKRLKRQIQELKKKLKLAKQAAERRKLSPIYSDDKTKAA